MSKDGIMSLEYHLPSLAGFAGSAYRGYCIAKGVDASLIDPAIVAGTTIVQGIVRGNAGCSGDFTDIITGPFEMAIGGIEGLAASCLGYGLGYIAGKLH